LVLIEGRIQNRSWEDKTGAKRYITEIVGENFQLGPKSGEKTTPQPKDEEEDIPIIEDGDEIDIKDIPILKLCIAFSVKKISKR